MRSGKNRLHRLEKRTGVNQPEDAPMCVVVQDGLYRVRPGLILTREQFYERYHFDEDSETTCVIICLPDSIPGDEESKWHED